MIRSRVQLATSYAPGVLLTWEGGKGICRSVPARRPLRLERTTERQIFDGIREFAENWQSRALAVRPAGGVPPALALDPDFFDPRTNRVEIDQQHFDPTDPSVVGYVPYPLVFQCGVCSKIREYTPVEELDRQPLPRRCGAHDARWGQVDVVYAHWSGSIEPLSPSGYRFDPADSRVHQIDVCTCGAETTRCGTALRCSPSGASSATSVVRPESSRSLITTPTRYSRPPAWLVDGNTSSSRSTCCRSRTERTLPSTLTYT